MRSKADHRAAPEPHLTEGELHTFLDGQVEVLGTARAGAIRHHLEQCGRCRDRLAVESAVRDRADVLLEAGLGQPFDEGSFESLQARAGVAEAAREPDAAAGVLERRSRWGWAAAVVVSLGVGYGVGAWGDGRVAVGSSASDESAEVVGARVATPLAESLDSRDEARTAAVDSRERASVADPTVEGQLESGPLNPALRSTQATPAPSPPAAVDPPSRTAGAEPTPGVVLTAPASDAAPDARLPVIVADAPSPALDLPPAVDRSTSDEIPPAVQDSAPVDDPTASLLDRLDPLPPTGSGLRGLADDLSARADPLRSDLRSAPSSAFRPGAGPPSVGPLSPQEVRRRVGAPTAERDAGSLVLEGLTIHELRWTEVWPGQEGLLSVQRLPDGRLVELRVAGPSVGDADDVVAPPAATAPPLEGWSRAVIPLAEGWAALDGPLAAEELVRLLATIR